MKNIDMTEGNISRKIVQFAIPLILGNILQQMYVFFDTMFVGRYIGTSGLAALGAVEWIVFIIISGAQGFTQGFSIEIAQGTGKKDNQIINKSICNSLILCLSLSIFITIIGLLCGKKLLIGLNTPDEIIELSWIYLKLIICGLIITMFYNMLAGILRSIGNSVVPLKALIISSFANIAMDYIFIYILHLGVVGAALGTLLAQLLALIYCGIHTIKVCKGYFAKSDWLVDFREIFILLKLGIPLCFQNIVIGIGGVAVQAVINSYGTIFISAYTAANKLYGLLEIAASGLGGAVSTFVGQNKGANNYLRVKNGFRISILFAVILGSVMSCIMFLGGESILRLFLGTDDANMSAIKIGKEFLNVLAMFFSLLYILYVLYAVIQGLGKTVISLISSFAQLFMRIFCAYFLTARFGYYAFFYGEILAWVGSNSILYIAYILKMRRWRTECK